jgi:hypothetical protein
LFISLYGDVESVANSEKEQKGKDKRIFGHLKLYQNSMKIA